MEIKVYLEIGKKFQKYNENWQLAEMKKKKVVCKTARRAHSQKPYLYIHEIRNKMNGNLKCTHMRAV